MPEQSMRQKEPQVQTPQLNSLISTKKITDASKFLQEIFSLNKQDYPKEYLQTKRVKEFFKWVKQNNQKLTAEINTLLEKNDYIFAALNSATTQLSNGGSAIPELEFISKYTDISLSDKNIQNLLNDTQKLNQDIKLTLVGVLLGQKYIQSKYATTKNQKSPRILVFGEITEYYPQNNRIGISLLVLSDPNLHGQFGPTTILISAIDSGIHEGTHGLSIANKTSNNPLGELATFITTQNYTLPVKSDYFLELWNIPILKKEKSANRLGSKNRAVRTMSLQKSFYLIHLMGPWIHTYLKQKGTVDIEKFQVDENYPEIKANKLYDYYKSGALNAQGAVLEAQAFCKTSGITDPELTSKIIQVFKKFRDILDSKPKTDPIDALIDALDGVFISPKIPKDILDGYAYIQKIQNHSPT